MKLNAAVVDILILIFVGLCLRATISLHSYSGAAKPPMYGDYEAQRHWQEITVNIESMKWYTNTSTNDLLYWGLDYPPLTAYHSYLNGKIGGHINESFVELEKSRGIESDMHKSFMRLTVLASDVLIYIPSILILSQAIKKIYNRDVLFATIFVFTIFPGQILIDNGHFQYNNVSLGLAALAIAAILTDYYLLGAFLYTLAFNYKQMELYHALPFFAYILRMCISEISFFRRIRKLLGIGSLVIVTCTVLWLPWIQSLESMTSVIHRLFPIQRGVFEDKVSNLWCAVNVIYKLRESFSNQQMALICLCATLVVIVPVNIHLFISYKKRNFIWSLFNTALAFFLLSFQVHEKSILLAALPAICLFGLKPIQIFIFLKICVFSLFPLFIKDNLVVAFFSLFFIFDVVVAKICEKYFSFNKNSKVICFVGSCTDYLIIIFTLASIFVPTPSRYPFLWPLLISLFSCLYFIIYLIFGSLWQHNIKLESKYLL